MNMTKKQNANMREWFIAKNGATSVTDEAIEVCFIVGKHYDHTKFINDKEKGHLYARFTESVMKKSIKSSKGDVGVEHVLLAIYKTTQLINKGCSDASLRK